MKCSLTENQRFEIVSVKIKGSHGNDVHVGFYKRSSSKLAAFSHYPRIRRHDYPLNVENTTQVVAGSTYWRLGPVTDSRRFQKFKNL
jgi:hypothetical protein